MKWTTGDTPVKPGPHNEIPPVYEDDYYIVKYVMNAYLGVSKVHGWTVHASSLQSALMMLEQMDKGMNIEDNRTKRKKETPDV